ncbi:MAG TPA: CHAT domain-containing tetratricopeptide repeat protein [Blastocatellia bacterium]|nr:CHAT domain-containing tetratricopeptide repeat protein [Blastocatellia bacterium]
MRNNILGFALLFSALAWTLGAAQATETKPGSAQFSFQPGQSVYIVAYRISGEPDLYMEGRIKQTFEKQKVFKAARKASESDFVFLAYCEYQMVGTTSIFSSADPSREYLTNLTGFAIAPDQYARAKGNLDALRDASHWHDQATMGRVYRVPENLSGKLVKKFHDDVAGAGGQKKSEAATPVSPPAPNKTGPPATSKTETGPVTEKTPPRALPRDLKEARQFDDEAGKSYEKGQYVKSIALAEGALEFKEKQLGPDHAEVAASLNHLARALTARTDYRRAESLLNRALAIQEKSPGANPPTIAETLNHLAALYLDKGDYVLAEPLYARARSILEKAFGPEDVRVAATLNNQAALHLAKGDYAVAESLLTRALTIQEKKLGAKHHEVARTLHNLGTFYFIKDDYLHAEPLYQRVLDILDGKHRFIRRFIDPLAQIESIRASKGSPQDAQEGYDSYLGLTELLFRNNSPYVADTLNNLAAIYIRQGHYQYARQLLERALGIEEKAFGPNHPEVGRTLDQFSLLYRATGEIWKAMTAQRRANEIVENNLRRNLIIGSERQKLAYLSRFSDQTNLALSLHLQDAPNELQAMKSAVTVLLRHKGRALDAMTDSLDRLRQNADPASQALLDKYAATRAQMAALIYGGYTPDNAESYRSQLRRLDEEMERIESEIGARSDEFRSQLRAITVDSVQMAIPEGAALVEFALYRPSDAKLQSRRDPRYVAYIVNPQGPPQWVELGQASAIDTEVAKLREALRDGENLEVKRRARSMDEQLMRPVRKLLGTTRKLLISPDGALNLVPFAALVDEENRYLVEQYSFTYLTSGRDLLRLQNRAPSNQEQVIIADPDFGELPAGGNQREPSVVAGGFDFSRAYFTPLPGTAEEAQALKALLPQATALTRAEATETALKRIAAPSILHIATHGFFLEDSKEGLASARGQRLLLQQSPLSAPVTRLENPLLRSGLGLAGANLRRGGQGNEPRNEDDGILTALEASGLNLRGTKLVVLSACDTGVGEIKNGDGVYGMRRALALAGSESQVMSLWPVSDQGTRELMVEYYKALQAGQGRSEGLRQVQLKLLANPKRQHPYYWASFIQSGEWASLEGKR